MKIKVIDKSYDEVMALGAAAHKNPKKQSRLFRWLLKTLSASDIKATKVAYKEKDMERLPKDAPCLILMNHSSFIDLEIASDYLYPRPFSIVCTSDGFVGKEGLMRALGCIPTQKFVSDAVLVRDISYALGELKSSVLMYPEASYTFDGTATPLPESLGKLLKLLKVPVVTIMTRGAFARDPLYNNLQKRNVEVTAEITYLLSPEEIKEKSAHELNELLKNAFDFDNFLWQYENKISINESFRADGLNRVLYKCPDCMAEGEMLGEGVTLRCGACGKSYELTEYGQLKGVNGDAKFPHIPDWYAWERAEVKKELQAGKYLLDIDVDICIMTDYKAIYRVGEGKLLHDLNGFHLTGCDGKLKYEQSPTASYGLYADYFLYEIGDMICIGDKRRLYYCFPKNGEDVVAKTRMAAEELFKLARS